MCYNGFIIKKRFALGGGGVTRNNFVINVFSIETLVFKIHALKTKLNFFSSFETGFMLVTAFEDSVNLKST